MSDGIALPLRVTAHTDEQPARIHPEQSIEMRRQLIEVAVDIPDDTLRARARGGHALNGTEVVPDHETAGAHQPDGIARVARDDVRRMTAVDERGIEEAVRIRRRIPRAGVGV